MNIKVKNILHDLEERGWSVQENFFSLELIGKLHEQLILLSQQGNLRPAAIGRENNLQIEQTIRSDEISWFEKNRLTSSQKDYLDITQQLQDAINQKFFLGLFEYEVHFALYAANTFYKRHLDQHKNQDSRVLTIITYLNENWSEQDGGALKLYLNDDKEIRVLPKAGTLVCFLSAEFEHEVLPAKRERASLTGWFRKRA